MRHIGMKRLEQIRTWLAGQQPAPAPDQSPRVQSTVATSAAPPQSPAPSGWSADRWAAVEALWGAGCPLSGGASELIRLATPLGLSGACSVLFLGAGGPGPATTLASQFGAWVAGHESIADPRPSSRRRAAVAGGLAHRASMEEWSPAAPAFRPTYYHRAVVWEPLAACEVAPLATALANALKPQGQIVWLDLVAGPRPPDELFARWARIEARPAPLPEETQITRALGRVGFDVRVVEDLSQHHERLIIGAWRDLLRRIHASRPPARLAAAMVDEAERALLRLRLHHLGQMRLVRLHAIR